MIEGMVYKDFEQLEYVRKRLIESAWESIQSYKMGDNKSFYEHVKEIRAWTDLLEQLT